jgi:hypothetical protein
MVCEWLSVQPGRGLCAAIWPVLRECRCLASFGGNVDAHLSRNANVINVLIR